MPNIVQLNLQFAGNNFDFEDTPKALRSLLRRLFEVMISGLGTMLGTLVK